MSKKDVAVRDEGAVIPQTPMDFIGRVIENPDFDTDKLEKLVDLQERFEDREAERAFNAAMSEFQSLAPTIARNKEGAHKIKYAPLDDIMRAIQPALTETGLSVRFSTEFLDNGDYIKAICTVAHKKGHHEKSEIVVPVDAKQVANSSQKMGSANSYAKRYALSNALNLAYSESDDDAYSLYETINEDQVIVLNDLLKETNSNIGGFLKYAGAAKVEDISSAKYDDLVAMLERKRDGK